VRLRTGIRALVVDPEERVALVRFDFPARCVWAAPGGGVEEGEDDTATLARELREELGLALAEPLGACVWVRTHVVPMSRWDGQTSATTWFALHRSRFARPCQPASSVGKA